MPTVSRYIDASETDSEIPAKGSSFAKTYCCSLDFRGETLIYTEAGRTTRMRCMLDEGYMIDAGTIQMWQGSDGSTHPVTEDERLEIVRRVVRYAAQVQGVLMSVRT